MIRPLTPPPRDPRLAALREHERLQYEALVLAQALRREALDSFWRETGARLRSVWPRPLRAQVRSTPRTVEA